jgi:hypothetical protein
MRAPWSLLLFGIAGYMYAGTLTGVVLEHASGRPLSRTVVRLQAVPSMGSVMSQPLITRTSQSGQFVFATVPSGTYLLTAMRNAYFPAAYGQRLPAGRGAPISIGADSTHFAELRMRHKGALTGRVLDENGVGSPGVPVVAYRARLPLRTAGSSTSDDRGVSGSAAWSRANIGFAPERTRLKTAPDGYPRLRRKRVKSETPGSFA